MSDIGTITGLVAVGLGGIILWNIFTPRIKGVQPTPTSTENTANSDHPAGDADPNPRVAYEEASAWVGVPNMDFKNWQRVEQGYDSFNLPVTDYFGPGNVRVRIWGHDTELASTNGDYHMAANKPPGAPAPDMTPKPTPQANYGHKLDSTYSMPSKGWYK